MNIPVRKTLGHAPAPEGQSVQKISVSLRPAQAATLRNRSRILNMGISAIIQTLLEIEEHNHLLHTEIVNRLDPHDQSETHQPKDTHAS